MLRFLIFCYLILAHVFSFSQEEKVDYLNKNHKQFTNDSVFISNDDTSKYSVYLTGEIHHLTGNRIIELSLFKNMYYKCHVRYFVFEYPDFVGKLVNDYIQSGTEEKLKIILHYYIPRTNFKEERAFFVDLRKFWLSLPPNDKFTVIGIDVNFFRNDAIGELYNLFPMKEYDDRYGVLNDLLFGYRSNKSTLNMLENMNREIEEDTIKYKSLLTNNYTQFKHLLKGSIIGLKFRSTKTSEDLEVREQYMYENLKSIIQENPNAKIFGQFGKAHIPISYQQNWIQLKNWKSFACRLNTNADSPVKGKVCSIVYFYTYFIKAERRKYIEPTIKKEDVPLFLQYCTNWLTLFKLDRANSPFKYMSDKFQYIIIDKI